MVVKLALKRKNQNIQIWSRHSLFKNTGWSLPASASAALSHRVLNKMAANLAMIFYMLFFELFFVSRLKFYRHIFHVVQLNLHYNWFKLSCFVAGNNTLRHYLGQWWFSVPAHIYLVRSGQVKVLQPKLGLSKKQLIVCMVKLQAVSHCRSI